MEINAGLKILHVNLGILKDLICIELYQIFVIF